jgi:hypothetical protein
MLEYFWRIRKMSIDRRVQRTATGFNQDVATSAEILANVAGGLTAAGITTTMVTPGVITISSGDAKDTAAGVGARTVRVCYLDSNYKKKTVDVSLAGQTGVTVATGAAVLWAEVLTVGSEGDNAGIIDIGVGTVSSGSNDSLLASIAAGKNRTEQAVDAADATGPVTIQALNYQNGGEAMTIEIVSLNENGAIAARWIRSGIVANALFYVRGTAAANTAALTVSMTVNKL